MIIDFCDLEATKRYKIMSQSVTPRPIAWIVTESRDKIINIAPFSYFTPLSSNPAVVIVSIGHKQDGTEKDTLKNILETKKATICFVNEKHLSKMEKSSEALKYNESEAEKFNISTKIIIEEYPPIIDEVESAFFCNFYQKVELEGKTIPIILEVKAFYFRDDIYNENLDITLSNIGRVGKNYAKTIKVKNG